MLVRRLEELEVMTKRVPVLISFLLLLSSTTRAQTILTPITAGACSVNVKLASPAPPDTRVELQVNKKRLAGVPVAAGAETVTIVLAGPLRAGDELRATRVGAGSADDSPGPALMVPAGDGSMQCPERGITDVDDDERNTFDTSGYVGMAVDNFAPAAVGGYADPEAGGKLARIVGGADFEFRALGSSRSRRQLWLFGETMHGVREADINCASEKNKPAVCDKLTVGPTGNGGEQLQYILDNATSMEAYGGFRYEFATLQADTMPAKLYATARLGVMLVNGQASTGKLVTTETQDTEGPEKQTFKANHAYKTHHVGLGLLMPKGSFAGSLLEVGWGVTELFDHPRAKGGWRRLKIDGALSFKLVGPMYGFLQLYADFDPRDSAADSVQTFYGVSFGVPELFR
jgi:hypothetical protein